VPPAVAIARRLTELVEPRAGDIDLTAVGPQDAGEDVQQRRLTRARTTDQAITRCGPSG
jgi:hypothetical protein